MLGIVFKGTAIPIYWMLLDKRGNSRYGLDFPCDSIVRLAYKTIHFQQALKRKTHQELERTMENKPD